MSPGVGACAALTDQIAREENEHLQKAFTGSRPCSVADEMNLMNQELLERSSRSQRQ